MNSLSLQSCYQYLINETNICILQNIKSLCQLHIIYLQTGIQVDLTVSENNNKIKRKQMNRYISNVLSNETIYTHQHYYHPHEQESESTKILIVEDEMIIAMDLAYYLEDEGYDIVGLVKSGEDAVAMALHTKPDIIIMDIDLPGHMDGIAAAKRIQKNIFTKIIFASGHHDNDPRIQRIHKEGIYPFIKKPYYGEVLKQVITELKQNT